MRWLIQQQKPQETLGFVMNKQLETFSFHPPINLVEERKWVLGAISEATNSAFNITNKNNSFSISTPCRWSQEDGEALIDKLK